ncbi:MAG: HlyD family type I secretion periplasmic adaptor subunit [Gammaproteobacteria bacterium]|nr:HlyD family type I secretion periplasmic adaptor subunit [Gammaproteobacteria bacterium]
MKQANTMEQISDNLHFDYKPFARAGFLILLITFGVIVLWSGFAPLKSAVVANGQVGVASKNKVVQHLDGGEVKHIAVKEGDLVKEGQLLLQLDSTLLGIRKDNIEKQLFEVSSNVERLITERDNKETLEFSDKLRLNAKTVYAKETLLTQKDVFISRRSTLHSEKKVLQQRLILYSKQISSLELQLKTIHSRLALLKQDISSFKTLVGKNFVAKTKLRELKRNQSRLKGEMFSAESEISRLTETYTETEHQILLKDSEYKQEVTSQLSDYNTQQTRLYSEYLTIKDKLANTDIGAPVSGKIKGLDVVTIGQILKSGEEIMQIVPVERNFTIQAQVSPMDIDELKIGQKAEMRLYVLGESSKMPPIYGILRDVSNDVYENQQKQEIYYKATLVLTDNSLSLLEDYKQTLVSGMPVEVMIQTGERTVLDYMLKPVQDILARAFNEA